MPVRQPLAQLVGMRETPKCSHSIGIQLIHQLVQPMLQAIQGRAGVVHRTAQRLLAAHLLRAAESRSPPTAGRVASRNRGLTRHAGAVANARRPGRAPLLRCRTLARQGNANATDLPSSPARPRLRHGIARETLASDVAHVRSFEWLPHCQWGTHGSW